MRFSPGRRDLKAPPVPPGAHPARARGAPPAPERALPPRPRGAAPAPVRRRGPCPPRRRRAGGRRRGRCRAGLAASGGPARGGLCALGGLPAAGKTSLGRALRPRLRWGCAVLRYDSLLPGGPEPRPPRAPSHWKQSRQELLQCVERIVRALLGLSPLPGPGPQPTWERVQAACREQGLLANSGAGDGCVLTPGDTTRPFYLILDDNFYYRSMRYEVYQLARKYSLSYCQIFLDCPLECCLQRNRLRSHPVADETICLMARKIEMPDVKKNAWERNSLILRSADGALEDDKQIIVLLASALENPMKPNEENTEQKDADRAACAASAVHRVDQACRRIVSLAMKDAKDHNILPSAMKSLAEELNRLKAEFLEDLRQGDNLKKQTCTEDEHLDPAASVIPSFQHEATTLVNKYILK